MTSITMEFPDDLLSAMKLSVVSEGGTTARHWIVTAYIARTLGEGEVEWQRG